MKYIAPIIVLLLTMFMSLATFAETNVNSHSPAAYYGVTPPTCSILTPNTQPPKCVDYAGVMKRIPLCSAANPSIVPPACSAINSPVNNLTPGEALATPQLADICNIKYLGNVPATSSIANEIAQQAFVNNHFPFKKTTGPCAGGCTLDNLIPLGLGGSNTLSNLWPQPDAGTYTTAMKNTLEATLRTRVCELDPLGYQKVGINILPNGAGATNLVGGTTYTATITVAATPKAISILGSDAQTFTTLITEINKDLSNTAGYQGVNVGGAIAGGTATGLTNDATVYTASISVDGTPTPIAVTGSSAQTYTTLLSEINTDLGVSATAAIVSGNLRVTSATSGSSSSVVITDVDLFNTLTTYVTLFAPAAGTDIAVASLVPSIGGYQDVLFASANTGASVTGLVNDATVYTATITVDGVAKAISIAGSAAQTYTTLLSQINTDLGASATASLSTLGNIQVESATTGGASTVLIADSGTNHLFASLTGYSAIGPAFVGPAGYIKVTATIVADPATVSIANSGADHLFAAPLTGFTTISPAVVGHASKADLTTVRGELTGNWISAYDKYVTEQQ
jgi:hypothetical protein